MRSLGSATCTVEHERTAEGWVSTVTCTESGDSTQVFGRGAPSIRRALAELTKEVCTCGMQWHETESGEEKD